MKMGGFKGGYSRKFPTLIMVRVQLELSRDLFRTKAKFAVEMGDVVGNNTHTSKILQYLTAHEGLDPGFPGP